MGLQFDSRDSGSETSNSKFLSAERKGKELEG